MFIFCWWQCHSFRGEGATHSLPASSCISNPPSQSMFCDYCWYGLLYCILSCSDLNVVVGYYTKETDDIDKILDWTSLSSSSIFIEKASLIICWICFRSPRTTLLLLLPIHLFNVLSDGLSKMHVRLLALTRKQS